MPRTEIKLTGRLGTVKVQAGKGTPDYLGRRRDGGALEIPLLIEQPQLPPEPGKPYGLAGDPPEAPDVPEDKKDKASVAEWATYRGMLKRRQAAAKLWDEEVAKWHEQRAALTPALVQYAQIAGIAATLGNVRVEIVIRPLAQDLIPGFLPALLGDGQEGAHGGL